MEILSEETITSTQVLNHLKQRDDEELNERQRRALEYLRKHVAVQDEETVDELLDELAELDLLREDQMIKLLEVLPRTEPEVRTLFSKERIKLEDGDIDRLVQFTDSVENN